LHGKLGLLKLIEPIETGKLRIFGLNLHRIFSGKGALIPSPSALNPTQE